ncbi:MAG: dTDP-glucose 4,6-dehydratase [Patescibacteria group bacterium]
MTYSRTYLVTGGAGFIGSNYLNKFVTLKPDTFFVNIDCLTPAGSLDNITVSSAPNYLFSQVDIRNIEALTEIFTEFKPTHIIHFAAESHVDRSLENPNIFIETNITGTHNLLALAHKNGNSRYHQVSTDEVYGALSALDPEFTEDSPIRPNNPYSASKASADHFVRAYHQTFGLPTTISRCSNNYGPRQDKTKVIPLFITKLLAGEKVPLYGEGAQIRDWLFVEDHIDAIQLILEKGRLGEIYNIGGGVEISNLDLTKKLLTATGRGETFIEQVADRLGHDFRYAIDSSKIEKELGWKAKKSFADGLAETVAFYR